MGTTTPRWHERRTRAKTPGLGAAVLALTIAASTLAACSGGTDPFQSTTSGEGGTGSTSGAVGVGGGSSTTTTSGTGGAPIAVLQPASGGARRLIGRQYVGAIRTLLGDAAAQAATPPGDPQLNGFETIGAALLATPPSSVGTYETSSLAVASAVVADPAALAAILPCAPVAPDDALCLRQFAQSFGRRAFRRDLEPAEVDRLTAVGVKSAQVYSSFEAGLGTVISALLQSPYFLYIIELGVPDPAHPGARRLTGVELATRMSFFLLNTTPDEKLLDAAALGALDDEAGVRAAATAMLARPEADTSLAAFFAEVYHLRDILTTTKDPVLYPQFTPALKASMQEETLRLIADVVWTRDADAREILTADYTFVDQELAALYGVDAPAGPGFAKVTLPPEQKRSGFLGQASFLARGAHAKETSPTRRGNFVREAILCDPVPPPPPSVVTVLPDDGTPKTVKQKLEQHIQDPSCKGCHGLMDPVGFALENFDPIGQYRTTDQGFPIDTAAEVDDIGAFGSAPELAQKLVQDKRTTSCMVEKLYRQSMGHLETDGEQPAIDDLRAAFSSEGHSIQKLLVELCASPAFRLVGDPK